MNGKSKDEILGEINRFPISEELKAKVIKEIIKPASYCGNDVSEPDDIDSIENEDEELGGDIDSAEGK